MRLRLILILGVALAALLPAANAHAFMTWNAPGNAEHERITRLGIACNSAFVRPAPDGLTWREDLCLPSSDATDKQPWWFAFERPMRMLAGTDGYFGGVGAPDRFYEAVIDSSDYAHCDNGDTWFPAFQGPFNNYPRSLDKRNEALRQCMYLLQQYVGVAVTEAGKMVRTDGSLDAPQTDLSENCNVDYDPWLNPGKTHDRGWAKCNALIAFGRALHITQDFFSHSNWVDTDPKSLSITKPQGLANNPRNVPSVLGYPRYTGDIEQFLNETQVITGAYGSGTKNRVTHDKYLNKDEGKGYIDWTTGQIPFGDGGHSERAAAGFDGIYDNFQRAAQGAAYATASMWVDYHRAIMDRYGADRGGKIWSALRENTPWTECAQYGTARRSMSPPNGVSSARRTIRVTVVNRTNTPIECSSVKLMSGEWSSLPPDSIAPGATAQFLILSNGGDVEGEVDLGPFIFSFSNPVIGSNSYSCSTRPGSSCATAGGSGNDARITLTITSRTGRSAAEPQTAVFPMAERAAEVDAAAARAGNARDRVAAPPDVDDLNTPISKKNKRELRAEVQRMRECSGAAARIQLHVDEIACWKVMRLMIRTSRTDLERYCPSGWRVLHYPKGIGAPEGATLCHQDVGDGDQADPDRRARAFLYVLPHSLGEDGHDH